MTYTKLASVLLFLSVVLWGCQKQMDIKQIEQSLIDTDKEFSQMAQEKGIPAAFTAYADEKAIVYRDNTHPIEGRSRIEKAYASGYAGSLSWEPSFAEGAASGDFGYTRGSYIYTAPDGTVREGYYISIWKKQPDGKWKYVFDSGITAPKE